MKTFYSWGNYPKYKQTATICNWRSEIKKNLDKFSPQNTTLAYGQGRSYGDSCLAESNDILYMRPLNRFISADWQKGIICAEAGITLEEILEVSIPKGWFLAVTPGTKYITLGGAIANDVHGKNHHRRGTFGNHIISFNLWRSDRAECIKCSEIENSELFYATIGGLGLTGIIEQAEIQLVPIQSSRINSITQRFNNLTEFFTLSEELDEKHEFCVSWVDCLSSGNNLGRGVYMAGDFANDGILKVENRYKITAPLTPPFSLVNTLSLKAFNALYFKKAPQERKTKLSGYDPFFYPLDSILHWNRIYGTKGFQQYQALIPMDNAKDAIAEMLKVIAQSKEGSFLAVLKYCGDIASKGLLSFPKKGITLALDFPNHKQKTEKLFTQLDKVVRESNGRLYPAKDAHMSAEDFKNSYPNWQKLESLRDKNLISHFWKRVIQ